MTRALLLAIAAALALTASGCDYLTAGCLYDDTGCALPGDWRLVSIDGETASGRMEIAEGFVDRETYAVLPTGNEQYPEMRGSSPADYSLDPDTPQRFDLDLWRMEVPEGVIYVDLLGRVEVDGDRLTYHVISARAKLIFNGGGSIGLPFPLFQEPGTVLVFER